MPQVLPFVPMMGSKTKDVVKEYQRLPLVFSNARVAMRLAYFYGTKSLALHVDKYVNMCQHTRASRLAGPIVPSNLAHEVRVSHPKKIVEYESVTVQCAMLNIC